MEAKTKLFTKKNGTIFLIASGVIAISLLAYSYIKYQIDLALQYCYKLTKITITHASLQKVSLTVNLKIRNKSAIDIKVKSQNYTIYANDSPISTVIIDKEVIIKGNGIYELPIDLEIAPVDVLKVALLNLNELLNSKNSIRIAIKGVFTGGTGFITVKYPISYEKTIGELLKDVSTDTNTEDCFKQ